MPKAEGAKTALAPKRILLVKRLLLLLPIVIIVAIALWWFQLRPVYDRAAKLDCAFKVDSQCVQLQLSDTPELRQQGLSGRSSLAPTSGMLFAYDAPQTICLWMKDMKFGLDMIWLDASRKVIKIEEHVKPETYPHTFCADDAQYVIEVNAGVVRQANVHLEQQLDL